MSGVTMVGDVAGTIAYTPPEQVRDFKDVRPPSDIYALGMTAYSLLTGAHALDINSGAGISETIKAIFEKPLIPISQRVSEVPNRVCGVIEKALAKEVENRWRTAVEMRRALLQSID
jgi:serine/threonine-protein kinase